MNHTNRRRIYTIVGGIIVVIAIIAAIPVLTKKPDVKPAVAPQQRTVTLNKQFDDSAAGIKLTFQSAVIGVPFTGSIASQYPGKDATLYLVKLTVNDTGKYVGQPVDRNLTLKGSGSQNYTTLSSEAFADRGAGETIKNLKTKYDCTPLADMSDALANQKKTDVNGCLPYIVPNNAKEPFTLEYKRAAASVLVTGEKIDAARYSFEIQ